MRVVESLCRLGLLGILLFVAACGSSNTEGPLQGRWFGPSLDGKARRLDFDGEKKVLAYSVDGIPTGLSGWIKHIDGSYYEVRWTDPEDEEQEVLGTAAFILGKSGQHAAFYDPQGSLAALQHGAETWNPDGYAIEDVTSVYGSGNTWFLDNEGAYLDGVGSSLDVFEDASYAGTDGSGRVFQSPEGEVLAVIDAQRGLFEALYEDQFRDSDADFSLLMTPDKLFVVGFANWAPWEFKDGWTATWVLQDVVAPADPEPAPEADP